MHGRYVIRPDREGFSVIDIWTGEPAVIAGVPQTGIAQDDADHTAQLPNRRAANGGSAVGLSGARLRPDFR
jgi:hypothetical protein